MSFLGYERPDGSVGTRNYVLVIPQGIISRSICDFVAGTRTIQTADHGSGRTANEGSLTTAYRGSNSRSYCGSRSSTGDGSGFGLGGTTLGDQAHHQDCGESH